MFLGERHKDATAARQAWKKDGPRDLPWFDPGVGILVLLCVSCFRFVEVGRDRQAGAHRYGNGRNRPAGTAVTESLSTRYLGIIAGAAEGSALE